MARKRTIKDYGTAGWKVNLLKQDIEDLGIKEGDLIDLDDCFIISKELNDVKEGKLNEL